MRLAIISDTHLPRGTRVIPESCLAACRAADVIFHAGDLIDLAALELVRSLGPPVYAVYGNVCNDDVRAELPERLEVDLEGVRIGMVHIPGPAKGRAERLRRAFPSCDAVIFGHTHLPEHVTLDDGFQAFNPGSPTERRRAPTRTMGIGAIDGGRLVLDVVDV